MNVKIMDLCNEKHVFKNDFSAEIEKLTSNESSSKHVLDNLKQISKRLYDHLYKDNFLTELKPKSFRKLLIDGFDTEQIFQQIELQNKSALAHFSHASAVIDDSKYKSFEVDINNDNIMHDTDDEEEEDRLIQNYTKSGSLNGKEEYIFDDDSDSSIDDLKIKNLKSSSENEKELSLMYDQESDSSVDMKKGDFNYDSDSFQKNEQKEATAQKQKRLKYKSVVDDQFFKLSDLEEFLKVEDLKAENKLEEPVKEDDGIDYFQDIPSDDPDESDNEYENELAERKSSKDIMYEDFFDVPESGDESVMEQNEIYNEDPELESDLKAEDDEFEGEEDNNKTQTSDFQEDLHQNPKTPFELEQEKIKKTISNYEESMIQTPDWHLTGEVAASSRPKNSLLHRDTDFDMNAKPVLVEDDTLFEKTEKAIKSIIKNKAYSDGQRKFKPSNDIAALKKEIVVEHTKSQKSLAEVYEDDYLKKRYGEQEKENPQHVEIKKMMDSLLPELQALFCHIPKPAIPDIKIVSNLPAITVEEVAPTSISDVALLAPEEVKKKSGLIKGHSERTDTDRKRERRKKKVFQKNKFKKLEKEIEIAKENPQSSKAKKLLKEVALKKVKQHRNTKLADMGAQKVKSSKDFFSRLQDTVSSRIQPNQPKKRKLK